MGVISRGRDGGSALAGGSAPSANGAAGAARPPSAAETAWLAAIPAAAVALLAILLLGPPLGHALFTPVRLRFFARFAGWVHPEAVEQGRYAIALAAPLLLVALTAAGVRARPAWSARAVGRVVAGVQFALVAFVALCLLRQHSVFGPLYPHGFEGPHVRDDFLLPALLAAAAATPAVACAARDARMRALLARWSGDTRARSLAIGGLAVLAIAVWLSSAFNTDGTIALTNNEVHYHLWFTADETWAVLDGRSPLANFATQYGALWPYAFAAGMSLLGQSIGVWVGLALTATGLGMLAIFAVLRRAAHSALLGLLLFLPVLATSFLMLEGTRENRFTYASYFGTFPLRYAGPSMLAWLLARQLAGARPRRPWALFLAAGLVVLNNVDAGVPALGATLAALLWTGGRPTRAHLGRLAAHAAAGLAAAYALVSALTLARAGVLADPGMLLRFTRLFARAAMAMWPMPPLGLHLVIYLTYVVALGTATVRALRGDADRLLTGMLAWSAVFGLGVGSYFAGRSTPDDLPAMFFPWSFALALLAIPAARSLRDASWRRPPIAALACVFGLLVMACSLAQTPSPWEQAHRLRHTSPHIFATPPGQSFIARHVRRGERVALLTHLGHRVGTNLGIANVSPYDNAMSVLTAEQLEDAIAALRAAGGRKLFLDLTNGSEDVPQALEERGFALAAVERGEALSTGLFVDRGSG
jgi:hypothetical protein